MVGQGDTSIRYPRRTLITAASACVLTACAKQAIPVTRAARSVSVSVDFGTGENGGWPTDATFYLPLVRAFEARHPGIGLRVIGGLSNTADLLSGQSDPDVLLVTQRTLQALETDLRPAMRQSNWPTSELLPNTLSAFTTAGGRILAVPCDPAPVGIVYDAAALQEAEVLPPREGWSFAQFVATLQKLKERYPDRDNFADGQLDTRTALYWTVLTGYGAPILDGGTLAPPQTSTLQALSALHDFQAAVHRPSPTLPPLLTLQAFTGVHPETRVPAGFDVIRFPRLPVTDVVPGVVAGFSVNPLATHHEGAAEFVLWTTSMEAQQTFVALGVPPVLQGVPGASKWWRQLPVSLASVRANVRYVPGFLAVGQLGSEWWSLISAIANAPSSSQRGALLAKAVRQINITKLGASVNGQRT